MRKTDDEEDLGSELRDGRPVEERAAMKPEQDDDDVPDDETIESVGY
jgi:hypothetical protein